MSQFLSYYTLCPINDTKEFLGLSRDGEQGCIINTLGKNIVIIIKLSNQKQLRSWTVIDRFTTKVVYDFKTKKYIGVFGNRYMRRWDADAKDLNKIKKIKFHKNIAELLTLDNDNTLIVYQDGSCESLESGLLSRKESKNTNSDVTPMKPIITGENKILLSVACLIMNENNIILTYFVKNTKTNVVELVYYQLDSATLKLTGEVFHIKLVRPEQKTSKLVGFTVVDGKSFPSLMTVWSDKRVFMQQLRDDDLPLRETPGQFVSMLSMLNVEQPISIVCVSKDCATIYGANINQEGSSLMLYNTQFKIVQFKQFFKVYFNNSRMWVLGNNVLLAIGQTLAVVPIRISQEKLSDMVGTQRPNCITNIIDTEAINEDGELEEALEFDPEKSFENDTTIISETTNDYDDTIVVRENGNDWKSKNNHQQKPHVPYSSVKTVEQLINDYYKLNMSCEIIRDKNVLPNTSQIKFYTNSFKNDDLTLGIEELEIVATELELCGASEIEITDKLIPLLCQTNSTDDLAKCLKRYSNISERMLVKILQYALSCPDEDNKNDDNNDDVNIGESTQNNIDNDKDINNVNIPEKDILLNAFDNTASKQNLINLVLSCNYNDVYMIPQLRNTLDLNTVLILLNNLYNLMVNPNNNLIELPQNSYNFVHDVKILNWLSTVLSSHSQQFILTRDTNIIKKLNEWLELIDDDIKFTTDIKLLIAELHNFVECKIKIKTKQSKWYSIQSIKLY